MPRYKSLDEIFDEPDEFGLLEIKEKPRSNTSSPEARNAEIVQQVNSFYERHGRLPDDNSLDLEEMKLGTIWHSIRTSPTQAMMDEDRNKLLGHGHPIPGLAEDAEPWQVESEPEPDWREEVAEEDIPESLDDIFDNDDEDIHEAIVNIKHVTAAAERKKTDHRADLYQCENFEAFEESFVEIQTELEAGDRGVSTIHERQEINVQEGDYFIHRGLLAYVAERTEMSRRGGKPDQRLRIVFSNGMEYDPLMTSFRKALTTDKTARRVDRSGIGPLDERWQNDKLITTGTVYVARSLSKDPDIKEVSQILHKVGVTSQEVRRRVADAKNDPTFLLAPVEIVATYELKNLDRTKVETLLHRFFEPARPSKLVITDRFGHNVRPREWFYVLPEHISKAVELIKSRELHLYHYDPAVQKILPNKE